MGSESGPYGYDCVVGSDGEARYKAGLMGEGEGGGKVRLFDTTVGNSIFAWTVWWTRFAMKIREL